MATTAVTTPKKFPSAASSNTGAKRTVGRSRRRRLVTITPRATTDDNTEKENLQQYRSIRKANAERTPIKLRKENNSNHTPDDYDDGDNDGGFGLFEEKKKIFSSSPNRKQCDDGNQKYDICKKAFHRSLKRISVSCNLWKDFPNLPDTLVTTSLSTSSTIDSFGLEENVSPLLSFCRKLIKDAAGGSKGTAEGENRDIAFLEDNLFVAVHILRSVAFVSADMATIERKESLLKLFYHLITTTLSAEKTSNRNDEIDKSKWIALAGYEGLAKTLSHYVTNQDIGGGKQTVVSFEIIQNDSDGDTDQRILFTVPSTARKKTTKSMVGSMGVRQLSTIALKTTNVVVKAILHIDPSLDIASSSYGSLGSILAEDGNSANLTRREHFHRVALRILRRVHKPWLKLLATASIVEREAAKDVISYSKGTHRLLWDVASTLKLRSSENRNKNSSSSNASKVIERECLELRKHAILHLFPSTGVSKLDLLIRKTSFENGCTYAWKAAVVFSQHLSSLPSESPTSKSLLFGFYASLDTVFHELATSDDSVVPLGLVEYRAHRALHSRSTTMEKAEHPPIDFDEMSIDEDEISNGNYRILLHIVELMIHSKSRIESVVTTNISGDQSSVVPEEIELSTEIKMSFLEKLMWVFKRQMMDRFDKFPSDVMNRILKTLCNLSLHKTLFVWMKQQGSKEKTTLLHETELLIVSTILTQCIGPFLSLFINQYPQKAPQLIDLMVECLLRPLCFYEHCILRHSINDDNHTNASFARCLDVSSRLCELTTEILTDDSERPKGLIIPISCLEKAAKSLYSIARERIDRSLKDESLLPLLHSLHLYNKLDSLNGCKKDYQLSSRLFLLSSTYQSMNRIDESFFLSCVVLNYEASKHKSIIVKTTSIENNILNFFATMSCGSLPPPSDGVPILPQIMRQLCRQMAGNLIKAEKWNSNEVKNTLHPSECSVDAAVASLLRESVSDESACQTLHPLVSARLLLDFDRTWDNEMRLIRVFSVIEILVQVGQSIQQLSGAPTRDENQIEDALHNYSCLYELLQITIDDLSLECSRVFHGVLGLIASVSIVPCLKIARNSHNISLENQSDPLVVSFAKDIATESLEQLKLPFGGISDMDWELLTESLQLTLRNLTITLQRPTIETQYFDDLLKDCVGVAGMVMDSEASNDVLFSRSISWLIWTITFLQNELEIRVDYDRSAIFSLWASALAEKIDPYQPWFQASTITSFAKESNILSLKSSFDGNSSCNNSPRGSALWIFEKELQLCQLRTEALTLCGQESFRVQMENVESIRGELEEFSVEKTDEIFVLHTWVVSTTYLVQSDVSLSFGCYSTALKSAQMCQKCCQKIMKRESSPMGISNDWMSAIATSTVLARASQRYVEILSRRSKLHYRLGDHRKAIAYMTSILDYLNIDHISLTSGDGMIASLNGATTSTHVGAQVRLFLQMKSWASTPDSTMQDFSDMKPRDLSHHQLNDVIETSSSIVHTMKNMITVGDILYGESISMTFKQSFSPFYQEARSLMAGHYTSFLNEQSLGVPKHIQHNMGIPIADHVNLREVRRLLECSFELDDDSKISVRTVCHQIEASEFSSWDDKAWALYYLGMIELDHARRSGALHKMWDDHECDRQSTCSVCEDERIRTARLYLSKASEYSAKASDVFIRNILRSLSLAEGPSRNRSFGNSAGVLILKSIGQSVRRRLIWASGQGEEESQEDRSMTDFQDLLSVFDVTCISNEDADNKILQFLEELAARTPENWGFIAPVICPSGEMLVAIIRKAYPGAKEFNISSKCIFPTIGENAYDNIVKPLDSILDRIQTQLHGTDPFTVAKSNDKEAIKRQWWSERNQLDEEMSELLERVESYYFSKIFDTGSKMGIFGCSASSDGIDDFPCGNLTSRFEAAMEVRSDSDPNDFEKEHQAKVDDLKKLTIPKLKDRLIASGAEKSEFRKLRKLDLIELLIQIEQTDHDHESDERKVNAQDLDGSRTPDTCLFLILDENLHRFPFEGMPILRGKTVCRVPCLSFVLATLREFGGDSEITQCIDPHEISYVVDPESNLQATQERITSAIESLTVSRDWKWEGIVGEIPPESLFTETLRQRNGLLMYFGHGGAQVCFSRRKVEELIKYRPFSASACQASVLLMGCSSGKLESINRKNSDSIEQTPLYYEPEGVALSYLCAGAPCVVGNLWDVTDNDIDRFSISLLGHFFDETHSDGATNDRRSLAESVSISRSVCKLQHLVGCAPVCYGVPVYLRKSQDGM